MDYDFTSAARHFAAKNAFTTGPHELAGMIGAKADIVIVDVRYPADFRASRIPGAINLPKGKWEKPAGLSKEKLNVLYCYNPQCHLASEAASALLALGYPVAEMEGGFSTWEAFGSPVETPAATAVAA
ncbi:MAG TPA: rhodanese-like domain-containing protein [Usitatibacteraceae bacterium]|nr:rhodanese-like domain-containing protein [Usitatibacteraceae bacterium]